jgi:hypothetical protein
MELWASCFIRRMHGGSQSLLIKANNGIPYIVKLQGNPQGSQILINEIFCSRLARNLGLPAPECCPIHLSENFIAANPELSFQTPGGSHRPIAGRHCAIKPVINSVEGRMFDFFPSGYSVQLRNLQDLLGATLFTFWIGNIDGPQHVFWRRSRERQYCATMIDFGYAFGGPNRILPSEFFQSMMPPEHLIRATSLTLGRFEPYLQKIERLPDIDLLNALEGIPTEWFGQDPIGQRASMLEILIERRYALRRALQAKLSKIPPQPAFRDFYVNEPADNTCRPKVAVCHGSIFP